MIKTLRNICMAAVTTLGLCVAPVTAGAGTAQESYLLGPEDLLSIQVMGAPEIAEKPVRIDLNGNIELTYLGAIKVAGLTLSQTKALITERLKIMIREPEVSVGIEEFRSQPVTVAGAVNAPGVHQIRGGKTLLEVLSMSGGIRQDAANSLNLTRRVEMGRIPLDSVRVDPSGRFSTARIDIHDLMEAKDPAVNILVQPNDVISVPRAEMVYVVGEVQKAGGYVLNDRERISLLKALSLAGGLNREAAPQNARILRAGPEGGDKAEIAVDLKKILQGERKDVDLAPEDILFIPGSASKKAAIRAIEAAIQVGTGLAIWRR